MSDMTPARLAEIRARAEKATPGPWKWANHDCAGGLTEWIEGPDGKCVPGIALFDCFYFEPQGSNAAFIAHARTDIPALLSAVEALQAEVERLQDQLSVCRKAGEMLSGAIVSSEDQREAALDRIWDSINAHGGTFEADDLEGKGKCEMIDVALEIIEREGGIGEVGRRLLQTEVEAADE